MVDIEGLGATAEAEPEESVERPTTDSAPDAADQVAASTAAPSESPEVVAVEADAAPRVDEEGASDAGDGGATPDEAVEAAPDKARKQRGKPRLKLDELVIGTETRGRVVGLAKFGAFVDIGAVTDGLVHVTEMDARRVRRVEDAVKLGDEVDVWVKDVDHKSGRVSLSMRGRPKRPMSDLSPGEIVTGTVTSATKYGVFVDIGAETEGLVHISEMSSGYVEKPGDVAKTGDTVEVRIKEIDRSRERISLSMVGLANDAGGGQAETRAPARDEDESTAEPEERVPTVVELALRRALGELQDDLEEDTPAQKPKSGERDTLGEVYERMLAAYKAEKTQR